MILNGEDSDIKLPVKPLVAPNTRHYIAAYKENVVTYELKFEINDKALDRLARGFDKYFFENTTASSLVQNVVHLSFQQVFCRKRKYESIKLSCSHKQWLCSQI